MFATIKQFCFKPFLFKHSLSKAAVLKHLCLGLLFSGICFLPACQTRYTSGESPLIQRAPSPALHGEFAAFRKQQIQDVDYQLDIQLDAERDMFSGEVTIDFSLAPHNKAPVYIDFYSGEVHRVLVNDVEVTANYKKWFFSLPPELFTPGRNQVVINYEAKYSTLGEGLHRYQDKQSGHVYLYTNFEPFSANKFFPHFDRSS